LIFGWFVDQQKIFGVGKIIIPDWLALKLNLAVACQGCGVTRQHPLGSIFANPSFN
jgi:hypothetical protein